MKSNIFFAFAKLPLTSLSENSSRNYRGNQSLFSRIVVDILDEDLWGSKASIIGNAILIFAILASTIDYVFGNGEGGFLFTNVWIRALVAAFFCFEFILRIIYSGSLGYTNPSTFRYVFSFIGIIDLISVLFSIFDVFSLPLMAGFGALRILRLWRVVRYIPSFSVITNAFSSRREDIITSFLGVILLSLTLSALMYHFERSYPENSFNDIMDVFIWSIGKYTGDYGSIALKNPISVMGKLIATVNGILGIALFALPAGLLASAFIEQLEEKRKMKTINERIRSINKHFLKLTGGGKHFKYKTSPRYASSDYIQSKFLLSESDLFECLREANNLRFRALKSNPNMHISDIRVVEYFKTNCAYGYRQFNDKSKIVLINAIGHNERGISHFTYTLANGLNLNFLAREFELLNENLGTIGGNTSKEYQKCLEGNYEKINANFLMFLDDILSFQKDYFFVILSSAASGRKDMVLEYGNDKDTTGWTDGKSTLHSNEELDQITNLFSSGLTNVAYTSTNERHQTHNFELEFNTIGHNKDNSLHRFIFQKTGAPVVSLYININILIGPDNTYYGAATAIGGILEELHRLKSR